MPNQEITNRDRLIKLEKDIGEIKKDIKQLMELVKKITGSVCEPKKEVKSEGWIFSGY